MKALLIGGGKVGAFLAVKLAKEGHVVRVIEARRDVARKLEDKLSDSPRLRDRCLVLVGDGTDVDLLKSADIARSDWVLAVSGKDDVNLVAAQLATTFGVGKVLARVNDPSNKATFEALDIRTVAVTDLMANVLELDLKSDALDSAAFLAHGKLVVSEINVGPGFETRPLREIAIPKDSVIVAIERGPEIVIPRGDTIIKPGDRVVASSLIDTADELPVVFCAKGARK